VGVEEEAPLTAGQDQYYFFKQVIQLPGRDPEEVFVQTERALPSSCRLEFLDCVSSIDARRDVRQLRVRWSPPVHVRGATLAAFLGAVAPLERHFSQNRRRGNDYPTARYKEDSTAG
jgi:hypothetical protein